MQAGVRFSNDGSGRFPRRSGPHGAARAAAGSGEALLAFRAQATRSRSAAALALVLVALFGVGASAALAAEPAASVNPVTEHGIATAHVTGSIDFGGNELFWFFEYSPVGVDHGESGEENWTTGEFHFPEPQPTGSVAVSDNLQGLSAATGYEVRLKVTNFEAINVRSEPAQTFTTDPAPVAPELTIATPTASYASASGLQGTIDPEGGNLDSPGSPVPIHWTIELSETGDPETWVEVASGDITEGPAEESTPINVPEAAVEASGLQPNTTYHYRLRANYAGLEKSTDPGGTFTTLAVAKPTVADLEVISLGSADVELAATINPNAPKSAAELEAGSPEEEAINTAFRADWHLECVAPGPTYCPGFEGATLPANNSPTIVTDHTGSLEPSTEYTIKLIASNAGGQSEAEVSFQVSNVEPLATTFAASQLGPESANLNGQVNPRNDPTNYWFEWGTADCAANPCQSVPASQDGEAGEGSGYLHVSQPLTALSPQTEYHYRLVAHNSAGTVEGEDQSFTTTDLVPTGCPNEGKPGVGFLPDCRAWEMVSPPDKGGGYVIADTSRTRAATDGDALGFESLTAFGPVQGTGVSVDYMGVRTGVPGTNGWSTHPLTPQQGPLSFIGVAFGLQPLFVGDFSADLSRGAFLAFRPVSDAPEVENVPNLYVRDDLRDPNGGHYELLTRSDQAIQPPSLSRPWIAGASADFTHVIFESPANLTPDASGGSNKLYEWSGGVVRLAGVLPDGTGALASQAGLGARNSRFTPRTISADGSRIFFTDTGTGDGVRSGDVYMRVDHNVTVQLNLPQGGSPGSAPATFWSASEDGTRAFITTPGPLMEEDQNGSEDLYMWALASENERQQLMIDAAGGTFALSLDGQSTSPIDVGAPAADLESALAALPLLGAGNVTVTGGPSEYTVVFAGDLHGVDLPQLTPDPSGLAGGAESATITTTNPVSNLTLISRDQAGEDAPVMRNVIGASADARFVYFTASGQLVPGEPEFLDGAGVYLWHDGELKYLGWLTDIRDVDLNSPFTTWSAPAFSSTARVTPDGRHLLFMSHSDDGLKGRGGFAGFEHDSGCTLDQGGACRELYLYDADTGALRCGSCVAGAPPGDALTAHREHQGGAANTSHLSQALSDDGRFVFFTSSAALVPTDTNDKLDAYRYDADDGSVTLLSTGTSPSNSYFMDASSSGRDAFILTLDQLVGWDRDEAYDVYDARIGGGFPEPPRLVASCEGDGCQGLQARPPVPPGVVSALNRGPARHRCRKYQRQVRSHGRVHCVKKRRPAGHRGGRTHGTRPGGAK